MKYILTLMGLFAAGTFLCLNLANLTPDGASSPTPTHVRDYTWDELDAIHAETAKIDGRLRDHDRFAAVLETAKRNLREGRVGLAEAADVVGTAAARYNRLFLEMVRERYRNMSQRESIALVLLDHFRVGLEDSRERESDIGALHDRLSCELWSWPDVNPNVHAALTRHNR
jgi:hypothetical protein